jgi:hypothetical protein
MALCLAGWSKLTYITTPKRPTLRMMCRLPLHIIRLTIVAMFLWLQINLVSNVTLFTIICKVFTVPPTTLNKPNSISLTPGSVCYAIGLNTEAKVAVHSVNGFFFARSKKSLGRSPL